MQTYSLIFKGDHGNTREIARINDLTETGQPKSNADILNEARTTIASFCAERNFKIYYTRIWNQNNTTVFDVGSHTEFFLLCPAIDWESEKENIQNE